MNLARIGLTVAVLGGSLHAQSRAAVAAGPKFEVAAVKALPGGGRGGPRSGGPGTPDPGRFSWPAVSLRNLIAFAYGVNSDQVTGPNWMATEMYSVAANVPEGATKEQFNMMLQSLLPERFQMTLHHETKAIDGYDLVVVKGGSKLKEAAPATASGPQSSGSFGKDGATLTYTNVPAPYFVSDLTRRLSQMNPGGPVMVRVADKTSLTGTYSFTLQFARPADDTPGSDIFGALESQLGLKLVPTKVSVEMLVVDRAQKLPLEN
jgi:uncharacterized protein (TIGR03435 family)